MEVLQTVAYLSVQKEYVDTFVLVVDIVEMDQFTDLVRTAVHVSNPKVDLYYFLS